MAKRSILDYFKSDDSLRQVSSASERECVEVRKALEEPTSTKRKKYKSWTPRDRAEIGKFAFEHGTTAARNHFLPKHPTLSRQTIDNFKRYYQEEKRKNQNKEVFTSISTILYKPVSYKK